MSNRYGPHRPEDQPRGVQILGRYRWPRPEWAPYPPELAAQRATINRLAHEAAEDQP